MAHDEFFPDSPRVFYDKAPLDQVVCQLRFPAVLKIEKDVPSEFQERIRGELPLFERAEPFVAPFQLPKQIADALAAQAGVGGYKFLSENKKTFIELTASNITFVTGEYTKWEKFIGLFGVAIDVLHELYRPSFYTRIGLRYFDVIHIDSLGLADVKWQDLLSKPILGELGEHFIEDNVDLVQKSIRVRNSDKNGGFLLQHGLGSAVGKSVREYYIDFDFYADQKTELGNARSTLEYLHSRSGLAWRWCITDELHKALGPNAI